jgi:hypothetical protein
MTRTFQLSETGVPETDCKPLSTVLQDHEEELLR